MAASKLLTTKFKAGDEVGQWSPLPWWELSLRYLNLCPGIFGHVGKRLDKKAKVNFKIFDVTN